MLQIQTTYRIPAEFWLALSRQRTKWVQNATAFSYARVDHRERAGTFDAAITREEFLSAKSDKEMLKWLNKNGLLAPAYKTITRIQFQRLQEVLREFMSRGLQSGFNWLEKHPYDPLVAAVLAAANDYKAELDFSWDTNAQPWVVVTVRNSLAAMVVATWLEKQEGVRFAVCKFRNCPRNRVFELTSKHKRKYCSPQCAKADGQYRRRAQAKRS